MWKVGDGGPCVEGVLGPRCGVSRLGNVTCPCKPGAEADSLTLGVALSEEPEPRSWPCLSDPGEWVKV